MCIGMHAAWTPSPLTAEGMGPRPEGVSQAAVIMPSGMSLPEPGSASKSGMRFSLRAFRSLLFSVLACSGEEQAGVERSRLVDTGALCVRSEADGGLSMQVIVDGCASGCTNVTESSCVMAVEDGAIVVHSSIVVEQRRGAVTCTDQCVLVGVRCELASVAPGQYAVRHGDDATTVRLPTERELLLASRGAQTELWCAD